MRSTLHALWFAPVVLGGCLLNSATGQRLEGTATFSGQLSKDTTWTGKIQLTGDLMVPEGITLILKPGTRVEMIPDKSDHDIFVIREIDGEETDLAAEGKIDLIVEGTLQSQGSWFRPVVIGTKGERTIGWGSLILTGAQQETRIRHTEIRYATVGMTLLDTAAPLIEKSKIRLNAFGIEAYQDSAPAIRDSRISANSMGASLFGASAARIEENTFWGNVNGIDVARSASPKIENNWLMKHQNTAIFIREHSTPEITQNTLAWNLIGVNLRETAQPRLNGNWFLWNGEEIRDERTIREPARE